jgi:hypothetical protein
VRGPARVVVVLGHGDGLWCKSKGLEFQSAVGQAVDECGMHLAHEDFASLRVFGLATMCWEFGGIVPSDDALRMRQSLGPLDWEHSKHLEYRVLDSARLEEPLVLDLPAPVDGVMKVRDMVRVVLPALRQSMFECRGVRPRFGHQ